MNNFDKVFDSRIKLYEGTSDNNSGFEANPNKTGATTGGSASFAGTASSSSPTQAQNPPQAQSSSQSNLPPPVNGFLQHLNTVANNPAELGKLITGLSATTDPTIQKNFNAFIQAYAKANPKALQPSTFTDKLNGAIKSINATGGGNI